MERQVTPYFETKYGKLYKGNCVEIMAKLDPVDVVLTDPPYNVIDEEWDRFKKRDFFAFSAEWILAARAISKYLFTFSSTTRDEIPTLCKLFYSNVRRLVWDKGSSATGAGKFWFVYEDVYTCDNERPAQFVTAKKAEFGKRLKARRIESGLSRGGVDIITRGKKTGLCYRWEESASLPSDEQIELLKNHLTFSADDLRVLESERKSSEATVEEMRAHMATKSGSVLPDVLRFPVNKATCHPCEKPVALLLALIEAATEPDQIVLDPFAGSNSTAVACERLGRKWIAIEQDEKYCEIGAARLRKENAQRKIFSVNNYPKRQPLLFGEIIGGN